VLVHLSGTKTREPRGTPQTPLTRVPSMLAFGAVAPDHKMVVTVVGGDVVEYIDGVPGPFLDEPDGTIAVGETHTFTRGVTLRATGEVDVDIEHVVPEPKPVDPVDPEPEEDG
jgi:hypothetical protein